MSTRKISNSARKEDDSDILLDESAFAERLQELFDRKETQQEFADRTCVAVSTIKKMLGGSGINPTANTLLALGARTNVSIHWLLTGKGPKWAYELGAVEKGPDGEVLIPESDVVDILERQLAEQQATTKLLQELIRDMDEQGYEPPASRTKRLR